MNNDKASIENILKMNDGKLDRKTLENVAQSGDASSLVNKLSDKDICKYYPTSKNLHKF